MRLLKNFYITIFLYLFSFTSGFSQCGSFNIVANKTSACAPQVVKYYVNNAPDGTLFEWEIAGNTFFGGDTVYQTHIHPATFTPRVTLTLPDGSICNLSDQSLIVEIHEAPKPMFEGLPIVLCHGPGKSTLTDITPNTQSRNWIVDGQNYSNTPVSIDHQFFTTGKKTLSLIVTDQFGCKGVKTFTDTIEVLPNLTFDFDADIKNGCIPQTVNFSITKDPDALYDKKYYWDFPGSSNERDSGLTPAPRTYDKVGAYDVTLTVLLSNGCSYVVDKKGFVRFGDKVTMDLSASRNSSCLKTDIELNQTIPNLPGSITWSYSGVPISVIESEKNRQIIQGSTSGDLSITLSHNHNGCVSKQTFDDFVEIMGVKADFSSPNRYHCEIPHIVDLVNSSDRMDANSLTYQWTIIDENGDEVLMSSDENPQFSFNTIPAIYDVKLVVIGDNGCRDTLIKEGYIWQDSLILKFEAAPKIGCIGQEIKFTNKTKPSSWMSADQFKWYFYDLDDVTIRDSSELRNPTHIYDQVGFYDVWVTGKNGIGCRDTLLKIDEVEIIDPIVDFEVKNPIVCVNEDMELEGKTSPERANFIHEWTFKNKSNNAIRYNFTGKQIKAKIPTPGEYWLIYQSSIAGGCDNKDSVEVYVNGVSASISLDKNSGCEPATIHPSISINYDFHRGYSNPSYLYSWSVNPSNSSTIDDNTIATPEIVISESGNYYIHLNITNSSGCEFSTRSEKIEIGINADNVIKKQTICYGDTFDIINTSTGKPTALKFEIDPAVPFDLIQTGVDTFKIYCDVPGSYTLKQMIHKDNSCFDTISKPITIIKTTVRFATADSFLACAPIYVEFLAEGENIDSLFWDFGNGTTKATKELEAGVIYSKNTLIDEGYDIQLIAKGKEGCRDTMFKEDYLVVSGPVPDFKLYNTSGCEPLEVTVVDRSTNAKRIYFNFNDGSPLDSTKVDSTIAIHSYSNVSNSLTQKIKPSIIVYDSLGCVATHENEEITIYKNPIIDAKFPNDTQGCADFNFKFLDEGKYASSWVWHLDGSTISTMQNDSILLQNYGTKNLELIASNIYCSDTLYQEVLIKEKPILSFKMTSNLCDKVARFEGNINTDNSIQVDHFNWTFGENTASNNNTFSPTYTYMSNGIKKVTFKGQLVNGCSDSTFKFIEVLDETDIDTSFIHFISFIDNYTLEINYSPSNYKKFKSYQIQRSDGQEIQVNNKNTLTVHDAFLAEPNAMCYQIRVVDSCDALGKISESHCFIQLDVTSIKEFENQLDWTHYIGWGSVKSYRIFRKIVSQPQDYQLLATVDGHIQTYTDTGLCNLDYEYYVQAIHPTKPILSNSYSVIGRPIYTTNPFISNVKNVTVSGDNEITIHWNKSQFSNVWGYELEKYENDESNRVTAIKIAQPSDTVYIDNDVLINQNSYIYSLFELDQCELRNTTNREGKSILLKGYTRDDGFYIYWTKYRQ